jgi:N-acyl-phosphatidylethanolamine-hydrolysing phospholipase D
LTARRAPLVLSRGVALLLAATLAAGCSSVNGPKPDAPPHHRVSGFANVNPASVPAGRWVRTRFFIARIFSTTFSPKTANLPIVANDGRALRENRGGATVTWVGHSTLLVQVDGVNVLTDPQWSARASPVAFGGPRRVTPLGLRFEDLPPIHIVVISHDHYDHLDRETVKRLAETHHPRFLVPLGLKAWLTDVGATDVDELDWWDQRTLRGLTITCVPAQHFSGRTLWDRNRRLWGGWVIAGSDRRLYFAGDTAYYDGLKEIGARLGPFDLAAIPIGAYVPDVIMKASHTSPEEALAAFADVRGRVFVPIHWGTFDLADEPIEEPGQRLATEARRLGFGPDRVWILRHGETRGW